jgi:hypothetical protein
MGDTMDVITTGRKGKHLNTLERYHIYRITKDKLHMDDTHNPIMRHYTSFAQNSSTRTPSYIIKVELGTLNIHKFHKVYIYIHGTTTLPHRQGTYMSIMK